MDSRLIAPACHAATTAVSSVLDIPFVEAMRGLGATRIDATVGPCIRAGCYEFGAADLDHLAAQVGEHVRATTRDGAPALDLAAGVRTSLVAAGVATVVDDGTCTACSPDHWSHRAGADRQRQAVVTWLSP